MESRTVLKASGTTKAKKIAPAAAVRKAWHAVSIVPKGASCEAAHALRATRFLSAEAPRLPLERCTSPKSCICAYKHHEDRRGQPRRKDEASGLRRNKVAEERRGAGGRRQTD
jgi:hypothetical protein